MEAIRTWFSHRPARPEDEAEQAAVEERKRALIEKLARAIVARRLEAPATLFLELNRPMGFIFSQATHFARPLLSFLVSPEEVEAAAEVLDDPRAIEALLDRMQELSSGGGGTPQAASEEVGSG